jgi:hypothetical protein
MTVFNIKAYIGFLLSWERFTFKRIIPEKVRTIVWLRFAARARQKRKDGPSSMMNEIVRRIA